MDQCKTPRERSHALLCPDTMSHSDVQKREDGAQLSWKRGEVAGQTAVRRAHSADRPRKGLITFPLNADRDSAARVWPIKAMRKKSESASDLDIKAPQMTRHMETVAAPGRQWDPRAQHRRRPSRSGDASLQWTAHVTFLRQVFRCAAHHGPFRCSSRKFMVPKWEKENIINQTLLEISEEQFFKQSRSELSSKCSSQTFITQKKYNGFLLNI